MKTSYETVSLQIAHDGKCFSLGDFLIICFNSKLLSFSFSYADSNGVHIAYSQENSAGKTGSSSQIRGEIFDKFHTE